MAHRREHETGVHKRVLRHLLSWSTVVRLAGLGGFVMLIQQPEEKVFYMVGCLALLTFGLPGAIRFDRQSQKDSPPT